MKDLGTLLVKMMNSTMVLSTFDDPDDSSTLIATTHTGSTYMVTLKPSAVMMAEIRGRVYTCREADVTINDDRQNGSRIMVGYEFGTRTLFVFDDDPSNFIRRSSTIRQFTLAD